jgi:hypothetical protein
MQERRLMVLQCKSGKCSPYAIYVNGKNCMFERRLDPERAPNFCWWEEPLVVALKHSEGIKHNVLLQKHKLTIN